MTDPFELEARYYDKIWGATSDHATEAQFMHEILKGYRTLRVLDLACGTGGHCLELAKLGYSVVGLDISQTMLEKARNKLLKLGMQASFVLGDMTKAYSILQNANIELPFDAVIVMGYSLAHVLDDKQLGETLDEVWKILRQDGIFIFVVRNAEQLRDDRIRQLRMDTIINETDLQLALLCYNYRDNTDPDILVWNAYWLIRDHGKIDFQVRIHPLKWFRYDKLEDILETHGFLILHTYGDTLGREVFDKSRHDTIYVICQKE